MRTLPPRRFSFSPRMSILTVLCVLAGPWEHVVWVAGGSMLASWIVTGEAAIDAKIEKRLLERAEGNKNFKPGT